VTIVGSRRAVRAIALASAVDLAAAGLLHVAWGRGSTFPYSTRARLHDAVVGRDAAPSPTACYVVAAALFGAAGVVGRAATGREGLFRAGSGAVALVLGVRGGFGLAGRTDRLVPGSTSERFRRLDRRVFAPLCLALGGGAACAALG